MITVTRSRWRHRHEIEEPYSSWHLSFSYSLFSTVIWKAFLSLVLQLRHLPWSGTDTGGGPLKMPLSLSFLLQLCPIRPQYKVLEHIYSSSWRTMHILCCQWNRTASSPMLGELSFKVLIASSGVTADCWPQRSYSTVLRWLFVYSIVLWSLISHFWLLIAEGWWQWWFIFNPCDEFQMFNPFETQTQVLLFN